MYGGVIMINECKAEVGIIGGSGFYDPSMFGGTVEEKVYTPYGAPSDTISIGTLKGVKVAFLARHGRRHTVPPQLRFHRGKPAR